jgi:hypothetical protein
VTEVHIIHFLSDTEEDKNFENVKFVFEMLSALELVISSERREDMTCFNAGRTYLLPFFFSCGSITYGPETVCELALTEHQMSQELRDYTEQNFTLDKKFLDRRIEEVNRLHKSIIPDGQITENKVVVSALSIEESKSVYSIAKNSLGMSVRRPHEAKTYIDITVDILRVFAIFDKNKVWTKVRDRQNVFRMDDQDVEVSERLTIAALHEYGIQGMTKNIPGILKVNSKRPTHPTARTRETESAPPPESEAGGVLP